MSRATAAERATFDTGRKNAYYLNRIRHNYKANAYLNRNFIVDEKTGRVFRQVRAGNGVKRGEEVSARNIHNKLTKKYGTVTVHGNKNAYLRNDISERSGRMLKPGASDNITVTRAKYRVKVKYKDAKGVEHERWETRRIHPGGTYNGKKIPGNSKVVSRPSSNKYNGFKEFDSKAKLRDGKNPFGRKYKSSKSEAGAKAEDKVAETKVAAEDYKAGEKIPEQGAKPNVTEDKKIPDKAQQEHWWRNKGGQFIHHVGSRAMTFAEKHPGWAIFTPFLAWQYLQAQLGGRDVFTQFRGTVIGWDKDEDGTVLGAKGLVPAINQLFSGDANREDGIFGTVAKETLGENGYNQGNRIVDDAIGFTENVGHRLGKAGDTISDTTHKIMDETGNLYDTAKDKAFTYPSDGTTDGDGNQLTDSVGNSYSGTSVRPTGPGGVTRQNVDFATMAGGGIISLLAKNPLARLAGGLAAGYGFEHNRIANKQMEMQQAQQQQQQSNQRVSLSQQPSPSESMRVSL